METNKNKGSIIFLEKNKMTQTNLKLFVKISGHPLFAKMSQFSFKNHEGHRHLRVKKVVQGLKFESIQRYKTLKIYV